MERRRRVAFLVAIVVLIGVFLPFGSGFVKNDFSIQMVSEQKAEYSRLHMEERKYELMRKVCPYMKNNAELMEKHWLGQINGIQRKVWFLFWIVSAVLLLIYYNKICFLYNYLISSRLSYFPRELVTLQKKDGKK